MAEIYEVLEIAVAGVATGKFRHTVRSDENHNIPPRGLCEHSHDTKDDARECPEVVENLPRFMRPKSSEELLRIRIDRLITQYKLQQPEGKIEIVILTKDKNDPLVVQSRLGDDLGGLSKNA